MLTPEQYGDELYAKDEVLERVTRSILDSGLRDVSIAPGYGRLLTLLVKLAGAKAVLEIGALGGYSGICLARGLPADGRLVSLELKEENAGLARRNLAAAGFGSLAEYMIGPALDSLATLEAREERFDFFFIDADKENYPAYLEYAIKLANPGALIAGDNILLRGRTLNEEKNGPSVQAMRKFNEMIARDGRLISTLLPAYDGLALAMVK
ncbi:O-methyltransferase [Paenibacillus macerans]|uniref:O-methyltransferase n=2 Tax=Paenibacillus macerans TaxID=44252 RepID=A0A6N8F095_PAEMA|nr:O-methyltransferase [Paenibacillus macerans]MUG25419.1 O-methyltransferase [Paenibacillus macerans]OMG50782.1 methyltransferase [Paenibacillus macerans]UMV50662.1 O-methyltransferase [Paenibacillus macerans]